MTPEEKQAAIDAGHVARINGVPRKANPYYLNTDRARAWFAGYDQRPSGFLNWLVPLLGKIFKGQSGERSDQ